MGAVSYQALPHLQFNIHVGEEGEEEGDPGNKATCSVQ